MNLLQKIVKILIQIGRPILWLLKKTIDILKKFSEIKVPKFRIKIPKIRIKLSKLNPVKLKLPKLNIKIPKFSFNKFHLFKKKKIRINLLKLEKRKIKFVFRKKFYIPTLLFILIISGSIYFYFKIIKDLPNVNLIYSPPNLSTQILDRNGKILYKFYQNENRTWIPIDKIPTDLIEATLAIEDKNFFEHHGLSIKGVMTAIIYNFKKDGQDKPRGGSTITQQLVKNVFFSNEKTLTRKIKEAVLTLMVERKMTKNEILERYLNQVSYGGEAYGVEEASQKYFGKHVGELKTEESAYLAGLPAAPSSYSPYGNNPELGLARQKHVISEMVSTGYLTEEKAAKLLEQKLTIKNNNKIIEAPHFVFYVKKLLEDQGYTNFEKQGLVIKTSLDLDLQNKAQKIVKDEVLKNKNLKISNGGALVIDVKTGDILAMVGSVDYYSKEIDGEVNITTALRQPGSSIKPINYLLALENNFSLASIISDSPVTYPSTSPGQKPYSPQNYNGKYMGEVTLRTALASSLNIPSVKLLEKNGVSNMIDLAESMGINTWVDRNRFGLSLALGSGEVKMIELAGAYSIFANLGEKIEINPILEIKNYLGENIYKKEIEKKNLIKPEYAYLIDSALSDNQARSPIFGNNSKLVIPKKTVAVKTGTTNNLKDNWCIGWTPSYLTVSWVGNNDSSPMSWVASGISGATPIWNQLTNLILKDKINEEWQIPNGLVKKNICGRTEWVLAGSELKINCPTPKPSGIQELATN
ncbi:MAG: PBP1A family penicillin-binding protein [Candidatus Shapirobacteria bacterium]|nr:PBP1A family penicillin-binding protein [Candidatus Shapirobacteria bacterium]